MKACFDVEFFLRANEPNSEIEIIFSPSRMSDWYVFFVFAYLSRSRLDVMKMLSLNDAILLIGFKES